MCGRSSYPTDKSAFNLDTVVAETLGLNAQEESVSNHLVWLYKLLITDMSTWIYLYELNRLVEYAEEAETEGLWEWAGG